LKALLETLRKTLPSLTPKLAQIARVVLDQPNRVATESMRALAKQSGVTAPTMIRFARELGFDGYDSFKNVFLASVNEQDFAERANWLRQASENDGISSIIQNSAEASYRNNRKFYQSLDMTEICQAADLILNANNVYVVSAGGLHSIASYLHYVGKMAVPQMRLAGTGGGGLVESLIPLKKDDVVITLAFNPYARYGIEATRFALSRGAKLVFFTDSPAAPLASEATILLLQKTDSPQFFPSMVSVMSAVETLISVIVARSGENAVQNIATYSEIRRKSNFYID
jgi:DNA-binding MurR/RpiR family transcriptional regulator